MSRAHVLPFREAARGSRATDFS